MRYWYFLFFLLVLSTTHASVMPGVEVFFKEELFRSWKDKKIGLITNHTGIDRKMRSTLDLLLEKEGEHRFLLRTLAVAKSRFAR